MIKAFLFSLLFTIFAANTFVLYLDYRQLTSQEIQRGGFLVKNIYHKKDYMVLKLSNHNINFWTSISNNDQNITIGDHISTYFFTHNIDFISYNKGFYAQSYDTFKLTKKPNIFDDIATNIEDQHTDQLHKEFYKAIFLATAISKELRDSCVDFGISHLVAISGFHLGVLTFMLYWLVYGLYGYFHKKYVPYRNIKFDILLLVFICLFAYLYLLGSVPSLLRAYIMSLFALVLHRSNIKIFSFYSLFVVVAIILAMFPALVFSLSLWLSVFGVFYIFLFIKYFSKFNRYFLFVFFNIWIYLALSPIVFYIFEIASVHQLYSPLFSLGFSLFYPTALVLHLVGFGGLFDDILSYWLSIDIKTFQITISFYFIAIYFVISLFSIRYKYAFWLLNGLMVGVFVYFLSLL